MLPGIGLILMAFAVGATLVNSDHQITVARPSVRRRGRYATQVLSENLEPRRIPVDWVGAILALILLIWGLYLIFASV